VVAYATVEAPDASRALLAAALDDGTVDALVLTSRSTVRGLLALVDDLARPGLLATPVVAVGAQTAAAATDAGFGRVLVAPAPDAAVLASFTAAALGVPDAGIPVADEGAVPEATPDRTPDPTPQAGVQAAPGPGMATAPSGATR
jgi:hypothetical protein